MMTNQRVRLLLLISLLTGLGALISTFAAGSHLQLGYTDGAFNFDFKVGTGDSTAASVLGVIALAAGLVGLGLHLSGGGRSGGEPAAGAAAAGSPGSPEVISFLHRLAKSRKDCWLGGVCGGLGEHTPLPSWVWRLVFLLLLCWYGTGVLVYVLLWICLPEPPKDEATPCAQSDASACAPQP
jgi:phage shock protein C